MFWVLRGSVQSFEKKNPFDRRAQQDCHHQVSFLHVDKMKTDCIVFRQVYFDLAVSHPLNQQQVFPRVERVTIRTQKSINFDKVQIN